VVVVVMQGGCDSLWGWPAECDDCATSTVDVSDRLYASSSWVLLAIVLQFDASDHSDDASDHQWSSVSVRCTQVWRLEQPYKQCMLPLLFCLSL